MALRCEATQDLSHRQLSPMLSVVASYNGGGERPSPAQTNKALRAINQLFMERK